MAAMSADAAKVTEEEEQMQEVVSSLERSAELSMESNDGADVEAEYCATSIWEKEKKHFFVLSDAGKPIFSRYSEDSPDIIPLMGVASLIIARSQGSVRTICAGGTTIVFLLREPLFLFCASRTGETVAHLRSQLKYLYAQMTFVLTTRTFDTLRRNPSFDIRSLLQGTRGSLLEMINTAERTPNLFLESISTLPLSAPVRAKAQKIIRSEKQETLNYAILMCGFELVALMQPKNNELHPSDLLLIMNFVNTHTSLRQSETWMPLCLPKFNPTGFLHGYCSYLNGATNVSLMLITTDSNPENFHQFQAVKARVEIKLQENGVMKAIDEAQKKPNITTAELGVPQAFHFVYACKVSKLAQCCSVAFSMPYNSESSQERLLKRYQHVYHMAHGCTTKGGEAYTGGVIGRYSKGSKRTSEVTGVGNKGNDDVTYEANDIVVDLLPTEIVAGFVGDGFEVYFAVSPLAEMDLIQSCLDRILKAVKRSESILFFMEKNTWS
eukprot:Stramenopile-MAST_4_protein_1106